MWKKFEMYELSLAEEAAEQIKQGWRVLFVFDLTPIER